MTKNIYMNMLKDKSKKAASLFLENELRFIEVTLSEIKEAMTVIVVGCYDGMYYENIKKYRFNYIGIEPYAKNKNKNKNIPNILMMSFESYAKQRHIINKNKSIFIFWFNVLSHIDIESIADCFIAGDIIINSLWGKEKSDIDARNKYYLTFDDNSIQYKAVLQTAKISHSLSDIGISFKSMKDFYHSPNLFELAYV